MKKTIMLLVVGLFLVSFISGAKPEDPTPTLLQSILDKLTEIKDVLTSMLTSVQNIEDKNETIIVNVEANTTKECQWEYFNTPKTEIVTKYTILSHVYKVSYINQLPINIPYKDYEVLSGRIYVACPEDQDCQLYIGGNHCVSIPDSNPILPYELPESCINELNLGNNNINLTRGGVGGDIKYYEFKLKILPANC